MQQTPAGCCMIIHAQRFADAKREVGNTESVVVDMVGMMAKGFEFEKFLMLEDVLDEQGVLGSQLHGCRPLDGVGEEQRKEGEKQKKQFNRKLVENARDAEKSGCIQSRKESYRKFEKLCKVGVSTGKEGWKSVRYQDRPPQVN